MVTREACLLGDLIETQRVVVAMINEFARSTQSVEGIDILQGCWFCALHDHSDCESLYEYVHYVKMVKPESSRLGVVTTRRGAQHRLKGRNECAWAVVTHFQCNGGY